MKKKKENVFYVIDVYRQWMMNINLLNLLSVTLNHMVTKSVMGKKGFISVHFQVIVHHWQDSCQEFKHPMVGWTRKVSYCLFLGSVASSCSKMALLRIPDTPAYPCAPPPPKINLDMLIGWRQVFNGGSFFLVDSRLQQVNNKQLTRTAIKFIRVLIMK